MTPEELGKGPVDETMRQRVHAIAQEAYRRRSEQTHPGHPIDAPTVMMAIEIALSDWTPPEPVDQDVLAFREWFADIISPELSRFVPRGDYDACETCRAFLAGASMATKREQERARGLVDRLSDLVERVTHDGKRDYVTGGNAGEMISARVTLARYRGEA